MRPMEVNRYYVGNNIDITRSMVRPESVDLVYIDPPFGSGKNYHRKTEEGISVSFGDKGSFADSVDINECFAPDDDSSLAVAYKFIASSLDKNSDIMKYLLMMLPRFVEIKRVLKDTGSVYVHCDYSTSHYLKVILDSIFGQNNYINDVIIRRPTSHNDAKKHFGRVHDNLLLYVKNRKTYTWNRTYEPYNEADLKKFKPDENGRLCRGYNLFVTNTNSKTLNKFEWKGVTPGPRQEWAYSRESLDELERKGLILYSSTGRPSRKIFLDELNGKLLQDVWTNLNLTKGEGVYPTQKSLALLRRIINVSSNEGDVVMDMFAGSGTTLLAAKEMNRKYIGMDVSEEAFDIFNKRYQEMFGEGYDSTGRD